MDLIKKLEIYKPSPNSTKTHTVIPNKLNQEYKYGATYSIPVNNSSEIIKMLYEYYFLHNGKLSITEAFPDICPLYIDIDIDFNTKSKERQYTNETIKLLVQFINKMIDTYFDLEDNKQCYIQEKDFPKYDDDGYVIKEGLHLLYPNVIGHRVVFNEFIRLLSVCDIDYIFDTCLSKPINDYSKIFDTQVKRWFVYGSAKPNGIPYKVTKLYINNSEVELNKSDRKFIDLFYLTKKFEKNINYLKNIDNILNMDETLKPSKSSQGLNVLNDNYELDSDLSDEEIEIHESLSNKLGEAKKNEIKNIVIQCISKERAEQYDQWLNIGMALKNTSRGLLDIWEEFSLKYDRYANGLSKRNPKEKWNTFGAHNNGLTEATLHWMAKLDNEKKYREIVEHSLTNLIDRSVREGGAHDDVAKVVYENYKNEFVCADIKANIWYYFNGTKWKKCIQGYKLQLLLPKEIKLIYSRSENRFREMQNKRVQNGEEESEDIKKWEDTARKIYNKLKDVPFQKNIMEACKGKFFIEDFQETMDSNTKLLCFDNCVFDLENKILRPGYPEDRLTVSTKYSLPVLDSELPMNVNELWKKLEMREGYDIEDWNKLNKPSRKFIKKFRSINDFLEKILPDLEDIEEQKGEIRGYTLKYLACRLCGHVNNRFSIWTGSGGNGKSILIELVRKTFGEYCMNLPVTILTQKRKSSNAACPEKARTRGARICYMQEPDENETINAGEMKELSGGDMILARNLYQEPFEFKPQWELVLMCNDKPKIEDKTNGAWRRVAVSPFNSRFVDREEDVDESRNVYIADKTLQDKVNEWGIVFMGILLRLWCDENCLDIEVPKSIRAETQNYKNQNDYVGQWFSEKCIEDPDDTIPFRDLGCSYQNWLDLVYGKNIKYDPTAFKERLVSWQKSKFGFTEGLNGTIVNPKINIKLKEED